MTTPALAPTAMTIIPAEFQSAYVMHTQAHVFDEETQTWEYLNTIDNFSIHRSVDDMARAAIQLMSEEVEEYAIPAADILPIPAQEELIEVFLHHQANQQRVNSTLDEKYRKQWGKERLSDWGLSSLRERMWNKYGTYIYVRTYKNIQRRIIYRFSQFDFI